MKRVFVLILILLYAESSYSQMIPVFSANRNYEDEIDIYGMEESIRCIEDTSFSNLTNAMSGISDAQWKIVKNKMETAYAYSDRDSIIGRLYFNRCLLEKNFMINYRRYEKKLNDLDKGILLGANLNNKDDNTIPRNTQDEKRLLNCTWKQVWEAISDKELVIECIKINEKDFAVILDRSYQNPIVVELDLAKNIDEIIFEDDSYGDNNAIDFWGDCIRYMVDKDTIYFSPSNKFSNIAIEYLKLDGISLFEKYKIYRVSSSREICKKRQKTENPELFLFGNIRYNAGLDLKRGDNVGQLPSTKKEINNIAKTYRNRAIIHVFEDTNATERAFTNISGKNVTMLHIASHGQYKVQANSSEEDAMRESILAFCGYNLWGLDPVNDGKVTAEDIASMDLSRCELVVLSACKTGLGASGTDGVYGLQRGFKFAGVDSMLFSVRDVHDEATALLMTAFYRELAAGSTKRDALKKAMSEIRSIDKYKKAEYWASFILLDALD